MEPIWRFLCDAPSDPAWNMAVDEAITLAFENGQAKPTLRLYQWSHPAVSLGAFQKAYDSLLLEEQMIPQVRRITGGRAILHGGDLTYAVIAGVNDPLFAGGISKTFHAISEGILIALREIGVEAEIRILPKTEPRSRAETTLCFDMTARYEIAAQGKKLVGSAQRRFRRSFLQQGSLGLTPGPASFGSANQITLSELLPSLPPQAALQEGFKHGFEKRFSIQLVEESLSREEFSAACDLAQKKYGSDAWTHHRTDPAKSAVLL